MKSTIPDAPAGSLEIKKIHGLIARARKLTPPTSAPKGGKRKKLGKGFDVYCSVSTYKNIKKRHYFLRKKLNGQRHYLCLCNSWEEFLTHMKWVQKERL